MIIKFLIIVSVAAFVFSARIPKPELRIVGGAIVPIEKAPYQVAILWYGIQTCGGVIYSERIILTAARCIQPTELDNYSVRVGSSFPSVGDQVVRIRKARIHEQYLRKANQVDPHDIAVLLLDCSLKLGTLRVNNINLATKLPRLGTECLVTGWGDTVFASTLGAPALRGVNITIVDHASCQKVYGSKYAAEKQVCASGQKKGSCAGDYGGPLVCFPNRELVAIVQGSLYCGEPDLPGVYGSVVYFRDWISSTIRSLECEESQGSLEKKDGNMEILFKPEVRNVNKIKVETSHGYQPAIGTLNEVETNPEPELGNDNNNENNIQIIPSPKIINVNKINIKVKLLYTPEISNVNKNEIKIESTHKPEIGNINNTESNIEIFPKPEKRNVNNNEIKAETSHGYQPAIGTLSEVETNPEPQLSNDNNNENNVQITPSPKIVNVNKINIKVKLLYTPEISNVNKNEIKIESTPKPEIGNVNNTESNIEILPKPEKRNVNNNEIKAETPPKPEIGEDHENENSITNFPTPEITNVIFPRPEIINENKIEIKFELLSKTEGTVESSPNPEINDVNENEIPEPEPPINYEN